MRTLRKIQAVGSHCTECGAKLIPQRTWRTFDTQKREELLARGFHKALAWNRCARCYQRLRRTPGWTPRQFHDQRTTGRLSPAEIQRLRERHGIVPEEDR